MIAYVNTCSKATLEISFMYFSKKEIYYSLNSCCIISYLLPTRWHLFRKFNTNTSRIKFHAVLLLRDLFHFCKKLFIYLHNLICGHKSEFGCEQFLNIILQVRICEWYRSTIITYRNVLFENESRGT
jgi:hypothetical protein